jgi:DNA-binding MarR family transcriptional regulator
LPAVFAQPLEIRRRSKAWSLASAEAMTGDPVPDPDTIEQLLSFNLLDAPGHLLRRNHQRSYDIFTRHVGDDVTRQQIALLIALTKQPGSSQRDLVDATGIDKSTLKEMIGRMIARGWIERSKDPNDSRAWTMRITPEGEVMLSERIAAVAAAQREIVAPLPESYRDIFIKSLRILVGIDKSPEI